MCVFRRFGENDGKCLQDELRVRVDSNHRRRRRRDAHGRPAMMPRRHRTVVVYGPDSVQKTWAVVTAKSTYIPRKPGIKATLKNQVSFYLQLSYMLKFKS